MIERQVFKRAGSVLVVVAAMGCTRIASEGSSTPALGGSAGAAGEGARSHAVSRGRAGGPAAQSGAAGARVQAAAGARALAEPTPELCTGALEAPALTCLEEDLVEPNAPMHPIPLPIEPRCGYVAANLSDAEADAYAITATKSDPLRVELVARGASAGALQLQIRDATMSLLESEQGDTAAARAELRGIVQTRAHAPYEVQVRDLSSTQGCQSYVLRVDPSFCTDALEDNDDVKSATKLSWDARQRASVEGTLHSLDGDFFEITTVRADPVRLEGTFSVAADSTLQLKRTIRDAAGGLVASEVSARKTDSDSFAHWLPAPVPGTVLRTELSALGDGCASYELSFDAAACSDDLEDNDSPTQAAPLPVGKTITATIHESDQDHFTLAELTSGMCTVTYDVAPGEAQSLKLIIRDAAGGLVAAENGGALSGRTRTLGVTWKDQKAARVQLQALAAGDCQKYSLRCDSGPSGM